MSLDISALDWEKTNGLIPVIVQDSETMQVLMLGYMNQAALKKTCETRQVAFYSRTKQRLWTKGEDSGNVLALIEIVADCDHDALLVRAKPSGPCCHLNNTSCFGIIDAPGLGLLAKLQGMIDQRYRDRPADSYATKLFSEGTHRIAQKVGEEGVELALAGVIGLKDEIKNEMADLIFHALLLLKQCDVDFADVLAELRRRMKIYS